MIRVLTISVLFFLNSWIAPIFAQSSTDYDEILSLPLHYSEVNPESPVGIFSLDLPFFFPAQNSIKHRFSAAFTMANTWHPRARFLYPQNLTAEQRMELKDIYMAWRPEYFEVMDIATKDKLFQSDGVLQHLKLTYLTGWKEKNNLIINLNLHQLSGGQSLHNFLVSDSFIEAFHSNFAIEDNFGRRLFPFNKASIQFDDEDGNSFRKEKGDIFTSVIDAHYYRQLIDHKNSKWHFESQLGGHLSIPLNNFHPYLIPGVSLGLRTDLRLGAKSSLTYALDGAITDQTFARLGTGIKAIDWQYRKHAKSYLALNLISAKKNVFVLGLLVNYQDPLMNGYYFTWDQTGYHELGVEFLQEGDYWEGEPISKEFYLAKLTPASVYYFSVKTYFVMGFHKNGHQFNITCGEDLFSVNNAPDIQFSFQYSFSPFGKK
ncbi:hypothetical protein SAMN05216283_108136 [Sunxiuqinia elliptica]|uniref:Uncharacterized protein n=1 Tax=Sunxiuqinia elliptica TaxID=655355 RepID=A0A1I2JCH6_9BACT|nr:hypothetical protein SAMN05216283_108136 [Sunxiuqinia elliptica]